MKKYKDAVSPVLGTMILTVLMITITIGIIGYTLPLIQQGQADTQYKTILTSFESLDNNLKMLIREPVETTRTSSMAVVSGELYFKDNDENWVISYMVKRVQDREMVFYDFEDNDEVLYIIWSNESTPKSDYSVFKANVSWHYPVYSQLKDISINRNGKIFVERPITGLVNIVIYNGTGDLAEAWLFSIDIIAQKISNTAGIFHAREENGAITSNYPSNKHVVKGPLITENKVTGSLSFNMLFLRSIGLSRGGVGSYDINMRLKHFDTIISKEVNNLRLQICGEYKSMWYQYLIEAYSKYMGNIGDFTGFAPDTSTTTIIYSVPNLLNPSLDNVVNIRVTYYVIDIEIEAEK